MSYIFIPSDPGPVRPIESSAIKPNNDLAAQTAFCDRLQERGVDLPSYYLMDGGVAIPQAYAGVAQQVSNIISGMPGNNVVDLSSHFRKAAPAPVSGSRTIRPSIFGAYRTLDIAA